ncbi:MAG: hypothetical protein J7454_13295, partial [Roseiflexus sp.]|nr:hypothetical protein [Roseiflexus sp.]
MPRSPPAALSPCASCQRATPLARSTSCPATTLRLRSGQVLGSASAVTNLSGSVIARQWYYPYGAVRASSGALPARRTFTGQRADAARLLHSNARYSDAPLGRFLSPDPLLH